MHAVRDIKCVVAALVMLCWTNVSSAHPTPIAVASIQLSPTGDYSIAIRCDAAAFLMQATPGHLGDALAEELRTMNAEELTSRIHDAESSFQKQLAIEFDGHSIPPRGVEYPSAKDLQQAATAHGSATNQTIRIRGVVPSDASLMAVRFPEDIGLVSLRLAHDGSAPFGYTVAAGAFSPQLPLNATNAQLSSAVSLSQVARDYLVLGFEHILPLGLDHILFVLALYLLSPHLKPLFWQVTSFTVAHSITLALSSLGIVRMSPTIVEPLIAFSIALIALENIFTSQLKPWRPIIIFAMGLIHGLGFGGVLDELGLPHGHVVTALASFNIGVELGQITVIALAFAAVGWFRNRTWYRARIVIPASCVLAAIGLFWTFERALG